MARNSKNLNVIFYRIGEGGNFLTRLFSLSDNTQFLWQTGTGGCRPKDHSLEEKLRYYSYHEHMTNWMSDAHLTTSGAELIYDIHNYWEPNSIIVTCHHYHHFRGELDRYLQQGYAYREHIKEKYFHIKISDDLYETMKKQIKCNDMDDPVHMNTIITTVNSEPIDMDLLMNSDETFIQEYTRVCALMKLVPVDTTTVLKFYHDWKYLRPIIGQIPHSSGFK